MKNPLLLSLVLMVLATLACKKDNNKSADQTAIDQITGSSWKIDTIGLDTDGNNEIDTEIPPLSACEKDDILTFSTDSTGNYSEGASKCDGADPDNTPFTWMFKSNNTVININGDLNELLTGDVNIIILNETRLELAKDIDLPILYPAGTKLIGRFKK